jgi:hypothetical protein
VLARHEVLGLQLRAAARQFVDTEVRQSIVPRAGHAQLRGAWLGREAGDQVNLARRGRGLK